MKIEKNENKLCLICMEKHDVQTVTQFDKDSFKGEEVIYEAVYDYCTNADEYLETQEMIKANNLAMKDAYRQNNGFLTSQEIIAIRSKYGVSQKDFSEILDWGRATITRYENHQVQDRAHDDILRKIESDPKWFIQMLKRAQRKISTKAFSKYHHAASLHYGQMKNQYLTDAIQTLYHNIPDTQVRHTAEPDLNKVIEIINYLAFKVESLNKMNLMKLLWFVDTLSYKNNGSTMTGLLYCFLPMVAMPIGFNQILDLNNIHYEINMDNKHLDYIFFPAKEIEEKKFKYLSLIEIEIIDTAVVKMLDPIKHEINESRYMDSLPHATKHPPVAL